MWTHQLRSLREGFRVIAPDLRGYGESAATPGAVSMRALAEDAWELLGELGVDQVAVVGLSMGGLVAMEMAVAEPGRLWALGLVATTAEPVSAEERRERLALADEVESDGMEALVRSMGPRLFGERPDPETVGRVLAMMSSNNPQGSAAALRGRAVRPDYRDGLRRLELPTWICVGEQDSWSTPAVTRQLLECLRDARTLELPGVGHLPNLEAPETFDAALADFLRAAWDDRA
jgi:3-oxoadipate enol-lactonase